MAKPIILGITKSNQEHHPWAAIASLIRRISAVPHPKSISHGRGNLKSCSRRLAQRTRKTVKILVLCGIPLAACLWPAIATPQSITPDTDSTTSTNTQVNPDTNNPSIYNIRGGQTSGDGSNLFHSFSQFGLESGQTANFIVPDPSIVNILGRVTGGNASLINGLLQVTGGNSNLFLMNPAGIVFGDNARLDVPASFTATTAAGIGFGGNGWFNATGPNDYANLIGNPSAFVFDAPGVIANTGSLAVKEGQNLVLLGGTVVSTGQLTAPGGSVAIAAVPGGNLVRITQSGHLLGLEVELSATNTANPSFPSPLSLPELLTGSTSTQATGLTVNSAGQVVLTSSGLVIPDKVGTLVVSGTIDASTTTGLQPGGGVQLLGNLVGLVDNAQVNVSGITSGGSVVISGDSRGNDIAPDTLRAFVGPSVTINANAGSMGSGGQVLVLSNDTTRFYGTVSARGGVGGGTVQISGERNLAFNGAVNTSTLDGSLGTLLLESANLTLTDAAAVAPTQDPNLVDNPQLLFNTPLDAASNTVSWGQIANLAINNNIILQATGSVAIADIVGNAPGVTQNNQVTLGANTGSLTIRSIESSINFEDFNDTLESFGSGFSFEALDNLALGNLRIYGGALTLDAQNGNLTAGQINTSSSSGNGGIVTLNAQNDIIVHSIDTRSFNGTGGNVDITAGRFFRAFGVNGDNASIDTAGSAGGGSIILRHGGGTLGVPFTVGADYNEINGTAGIISTGQNNQIPSGSFRGSYRQGNPPSDIQLITPGTSQLPQTILSRTDFSLSETDNTNVNNIVSSRLPLVEIDTAFEQLEESFTRQFQEYFGRTFNSAIVSLTQARQTLQKIEQTTGTKPSLIYVVFVPSKLDSQINEGTPTPRSTDQLQLLLVTAQGKPILKPVEGATRDRVLKMAQEFRSEVTNVQDSRGYRRSAQQLYQWLVKPLESELQAKKINNLVFLLDSGLRSIPIAALHDGQEFLVERYSVSLMPSLSLTDTRYHDIRQSQVLAMGAETFADQKPLPAVPLELSLITGQLWNGKSFLNNAFTLENLKAQRQQTPFGIIHLATHADFQPGSPDKSYIQLSNGKLRLDQLPQLGWNDPPLDLLVLSACRTALGDEKAELGFAGLAVQAGVKATLASLWYVSDEATLGLMSQFYEQLQTTPTKAEALRQAQLAMLNGRVHIKSDQLFDDRGSLPLPTALAGLGARELTHPYYWAAFTLVGNPW